MFFSSNPFPKFLDLVILLGVSLFIRGDVSTMGVFSVFVLCRQLNSLKKNFSPHGSSDSRLATENWGFNGNG